MNTKYVILYKKSSICAEGAVCLDASLHSCKLRVIVRFDLPVEIQRMELEDLSIWVSNH